MKNEKLKETIEEIEEIIKYINEEWECGDDSYKLAIEVHKNYMTKLSLNAVDTNLQYMKQQMEEVNGRS